MLKNFFAAIFFATMIFLVSQNNFVEAKDVYVGTSKSTGWKCYLMTETIRGDQFQRYATLKMITKVGKIHYLDYYFFIQDHKILFENSQGYSGVVNSSTPIEQNMWDYNTIQ